MPKQHITHFLQPPHMTSSPFIIGDNQLVICDGVNPSYEDGVLWKDLGYAQVGSTTLQAGKPIRSLYHFRQSSSVDKLLATCDDSGANDTQLFYSTGVNTTVDVSSASGQKVISVASTTGFLAGDKVVLDKGNTNEETKIIDTISAGVSITVTVNLASTHAIGVTVESDWTEIPAAETAWANDATMDVETESFLGYCFFVGHSSTDGFLAVGSLTGTTFSTATNVTSMPGAKYIKRYRDRLYIANCDISGTAYPYRVYYSSIPSAGAITWTVASDFFDVDYSEQITGIEQNWDRLMVFTEFDAYMYDQASRRKVWNVGCAGQRTIQNMGAYMIFTNKNNVYLSTGGRPEAIGNPILQLLRASTPSNWRTAVVDEEYHIYLGDSVSAFGFTYTNLIATWNKRTNMWRWRQLLDSVDSLAKYTTSGDDFLTLGCADSEIHKKSKYTDATPIYADDGASISAHFRTGAYDMGDPSVSKKITRLVIYTEYANGLSLRYRIYDKNREVLMPFTHIGTLKKVVNDFKNIKGLEGNIIQFEGRERSDMKAFKFFGFSMNYELAKIK